MGYTADEMRIIERQAEEAAMRAEMERAQEEQMAEAAMAWQQWLDHLESIMREWDAKHGNLPYALPLAESTGLDCWRDSYDDGMTPADAFASDQSHWE